MKTIHHLTALAALVLVSCQEKNEFAAPPPIPVTVAHPVKREQVVYRSFPATLKGVTEAEIRVRVRGILEKQFFTEGELVKEGAPLYLIEQAPYKAEVAARQANVRQAEAARDIAKASLGRLERAGSRAVSQNDIDVAQAEFEKALAIVAQNEALLEQAELDFEYTEIKAPTSGRMSSSLVDVGNLVDGAQSTQLTSITDDSAIRAYFELPERIFLEFLATRTAHAASRVEGLEPVRLELTDGTLYSEEGKIDFVADRVDPSTRTATVRAVFPNPKGQLASGLYGLVGYPQMFGTEKKFPDAVLIPSSSVLRDLAGDFVWVIDGENVVRRRGVETGETVRKPNDDPSAPEQREILILKGLDPEDRVIVAGLQRAREGATVAPEFSDAPPLVPVPAAAPKN